MMCQFSENIGNDILGGWEGTLRVCVLLRRLARYVRLEHMLVVFFFLSDPESDELVRQRSASTKSRNAQMSRIKVLPVSNVVVAAGGEQLGGQAECDKYEEHQVATCSLEIFSI